MLTQGCIHIHVHTTQAIGNVRFYKRQAAAIAHLLSIATNFLMTHHREEKNHVKIDICSLLFCRQKSYCDAFYGLKMNTDNNTALPGYHCFPLQTHPSLLGIQNGDGSLLADQSSRTQNQKAVSTPPGMVLLNLLLHGQPKFNRLFQGASIA